MTRHFAALFYHGFLYMQPCSEQTPGRAFLAHDDVPAFFGRLATFGTALSLIQADADAAWPYLFYRAFFLQTAATGGIHYPHTLLCLAG